MSEKFLKKYPEFKDLQSWNSTYKVYDSKDIMKILDEHFVRKHEEHTASFDFVGVEDKQFISTEKVKEVIDKVDEFLDCDHHQWKRRLEEELGI